MEDSNDIIDLTKDSPANKTVRRGRNAAASTRSRRNNSVKTQLPLEDSVVLLSSHDSENEESTENICEPVEIIDLDEIEASKQNDRYYFSSPKGKLNLLQCPICLEELTSTLKPMSTRCGHIFCTPCLGQVLVTQKKCPTCQGKITQKSCTRLYF